MTARGVPGGGVGSGIGRIAWLLLPLLFLLPVVVDRWGGGPRPAGGGGTADRPLYGKAALDSIVSSFEGELLLIDFWATWCEGCMEELPVLDSLHVLLRRERGEDYALFIALDVGDPDSSVLREGRMPGLPASIPVVWLDPAEAAGVLARWEIPDILPYVIVLDERGEVVCRAAGGRSAPELAEMLRECSGDPELLTEVGPGSAETPGGRGVHVFVVGSPGEDSTDSLLATALTLAPDSAVELLDPRIEEDLRRMDSLHLPLQGVPYAQPCVGSSCGRLVFSPADLRQAVLTLTGNDGEE